MNSLKEKTIDELRFLKENCNVYMERVISIIIKEKIVTQNMELCEQFMSDIENKTIDELNNAKIINLSNNCFGYKNIDIINAKIKLLKRKRVAEHVKLDKQNLIDNRIQMLKNEYDYYISVHGNSRHYDNLYKQFTIDNEIFDKIQIEKEIIILSNNIKRREKRERSHEFAERNEMSMNDKDDKDDIDNVHRFIMERRACVILQKENLCQENEKLLLQIKKENEQATYLKKCNKIIKANEFLEKTNMEQKYSKKDKMRKKLTMKLKKIMMILK